MRILVTTHHLYAGLGVFAGPLAAGDHDVVEWMPPAERAPVVATFDALIVLGGQARVDAEDAYPWLRAEQDVVHTALHVGVPVLGVCLGAQVLATVAGGVTRRAVRSEIGWHQIRLTRAGASDPVIGVLPERFEAFEWHHDEFLLPAAAVSLARNTTCLQAFRLRDRPAWGVQFHPEATHDDLCTWLEGWHADPDAIATGLDPEAIRRDTAERIGDSNELGCAIVERFLACSSQ